jgi:hypothetical protein
LAAASAIACVAVASAVVTASAYVAIRAVSSAAFTSAAYTSIASASVAANAATTAKFASLMSSCAGVVCFLGLCVEGGEVVFCADAPGGAHCGVASGRGRREVVVEGCAWWGSLSLGVLFHFHANGSR